MFKYIAICSSSLFIIFNFKDVNAWQHEIAIGYGNGKEIEQNYRNNGIVLTGKLYKFPKIDDTLYITIDATLANIHANTKEHNQITTIALFPAGRAYFADPTLHTIRPYLQASFGPTYLSSRTLGNRTQGSHFAFQTAFEMGTEIGNQLHSYDINLRMIHICNAGLSHPNQGINLVPILSLGYQF